MSPAGSMHLATNARLSNARESVVRVRVVSLYEGESGGQIVGNRFLAKLLQASSSTKVCSFLLERSKLAIEDASFKWSVT